MNCSRKFESMADFYRWLFEQEVSEGQSLVHCTKAMSVEDRAVARELMEEANRD